jgi:hypothetical protein
VAAHYVLEESSPRLNRATNVNLVQLDLQAMLEIVRVQYVLQGDILTLVRVIANYAQWESIKTLTMEQRALNVQEIE